MLRGRNPANFLSDDCWMNSDFEIKLQRCCDIQNRRGHASLFARETSEDKQIVELATAREWAESAGAKYGIVVSGIVSNSNSNVAPDCFAQLNGGQIGIELTELVDPELLRCVAAERKSDRVFSAYHGIGFQQAQWDQTRFCHALNEILAKKDKKYEGQSFRADVLIVHTDEPWLSPHDVERWLAQNTFEHRPSLKTVYFLMTYVPGYSLHWPVFQVY